MSKKPGFFQRIKMNVMTNFLDKLIGGLLQKLPTKWYAVLSIFSTGLFAVATHPQTAEVLNNEGLSATLIQIVSFIAALFTGANSKPDRQAMKSKKQ